MSENTSPAPVVPGVVTPGVQTSEYKTTKLVIYMGIFTMLVGFLTDVLTAVQVLAPQWLWVGVALIIIGKVSMLLKALGYDATRASIHNAGQAAAAHVAAAQATVPMSADDAAAKVFAKT